MSMEEKNADGMVSISELRELLLLNGKEVLNTRETAMYLGCSEAWVNQQACHREIPHYKKGAVKYFKKSELDEWRLEERVPTRRQMEMEAENLCGRRSRR